MTTPAEGILTTGFVEEVIGHMNTDHADSLKDYARAFAAVDWADNVVMTELQISGIGLLCQSDAGREEAVWVAFEAEIKRQEQVRGVLVALAKNARKSFGRNQT